MPLRTYQPLFGERLESKRLLAADLLVLVEELPQAVRATNELAYVVRVQNQGPDAADASIEIGIGGLEQFQWTRQVPDDLPEQLDLGVGEIDDLFAVEPGEEIVYRVRGVVPHDADAINATAVVQHVGADELNQSNNSFFSELVVEPQELAEVVDVRVNIESDPVERQPAEIAEYVVRLSNVGDTYAAAVQVNNPLSNLEALSWTSSDGLSGQGNFSTSVNLEPGGERVFTVNARVGRGPESEFQVTLRPRLGQVDEKPEDNADIVTELVPLNRQIPLGLNYVTMCYEETYVLGDALYFVGWSGTDGSPCQLSRASASSGFYGGTLWRTDGTAEGTHVVKDIRPQQPDEPGLFDPFVFTPAGRPEFLEYNGLLYFVADDGQHGAELWRSDGTESGTYMVKDINSTVRVGARFNFCPLPHNQSSEIRKLQVFDELLAFEASDGETTSTWVSDGTADGTRQVDGIELVDISPVSMPSDPVVKHVNDRFVRVDETGREVVIANWPGPWGLDRFLRNEEVTNIRVLNDTVIFNSSEDFSNGIANPLYSIALYPDQVEILAPLFLQNNTESNIGTVAKSTATEVLHFIPTVTDDMDDRTKSVLDQNNPFHALGSNTAVVAMERSVGSADAPLGTITLGFPAPIIDGPGVDIEVHITPDLRDVSPPPITIWGVSENGDVEKITSFDRNAPQIDLATSEGNGPYVALRFEADRNDFWGFQLEGVEATIDADIIFSATSTALDVDHEFSWDLNNDQVFGDRIGRSIGLKFEDLAAFGIDQPGEHPIAVKLNNRVLDVFAESVLVVPDEEIEQLAGDINRDGAVSFADFLLVSTNFGKTNALSSEGDVDENGVVDFADFLLLSQNFGNQVR